MGFFALLTVIGIQDQCELHSERSCLPKENKTRQTYRNKEGKRESKQARKEEKRKKGGIRKEEIKKREGK